MATNQGIIDPDPVKLFSLHLFTAYTRRKVAPPHLVTNNLATAVDPCISYMPFPIV